MLISALSTLPRRAGAARLRFLLLPALILTLAPPASAELRVRLSRSVTGSYESVGITVTDPRGGSEAGTEPVTVTMADRSDWRQSIHLEPTGRPGEWWGRFTPVKTGRYTGTALLQRGDEQDIGLVPLIQVRPSDKPGFVRLHPSSKRALKYTPGPSLFPVGVRFSEEDLRLGVDWRAELRRLRAHDANYVEIPVVWPGDLPERERLEALRQIDVALVEAELRGRVGIQLRLLPPSSLDADGIADYEEQLRRWARRWSYSTAVAVFYIAGATDEVAPEVRARFVRAVRGSDPYRHLIAIPGGASEARAGADIAVYPWNWQRPANRFALLEVPEQASGPAPLPGENSWQMLVLGGVGLPLWPYRPAAPDSTQFLQRLQRLSRVAGSIPYQGHARPISGVVSVDTPGSFCRYGRVWVGWLAPENISSIPVTPLPRGQYRARVWDPGNDVHVRDTILWSDGSRHLQVDLPQDLNAVYVQVQPAEWSVGPPSMARSGFRRGPAVAAVQPATQDTTPEQTVTPPAARARNSAAAWEARRRKRAAAWARKVEVARANRAARAARAAEAAQAARVAYAARAERAARAAAAERANRAAKAARAAQFAEARRAAKAAKAARAGQAARAAKAARAEKAARVAEARRAAKAARAARAGTNPQSATVRSRKAKAQQARAAKVEATRVSRAKPKTTAKPTGAVAKARAARAWAAHLARVTEKAKAAAMKLEKVAIRKKRAAMAREAKAGKKKTARKSAGKRRAMQ